MTQDGSQIQLRMPNNSNVDSDLQGKLISVNIDDSSRNSVVNAYANVIEEGGDPWTAQAIRKNIQYRRILEQQNTPIKTEDWSPVLKDSSGNSSGVARYNPNNQSYEVGFSEDNLIEFSDIMRAEGSINKKLLSGFAGKANKLEYYTLNNPQKMLNALKAWKSGNYQNRRQRKEINSFLDSAVPFDHKGMALDYLSRMSQTQE
jgi:hypothetical protein